MTTIQIKDGASATIYTKASGSGSAIDPFIPEHADVVLQGLVLTDAQMRASAVPVSLATVPSHPVTNSGTFPVQAALTAAEVHAGAVGGHTAVLSTEITTTGTQAAYAANDAVLVNGGGISEIQNAARVSGGSGYITGIRVITNKKSITPRLRVHFFNTTGPTISADNAAWQEKYTDISKRVGSWDMPAMITAADTTNSDMSRAQDTTMRIPFACAVTSLYFALETLDAFTPDNSQKFTIILIVEQN